MAAILVAMGCLLTASAAANAERVEVRVTNMAPEDGTYLTPVWVGFHDGTFDTFDTGSAASDALERLAEDGNASPLNSDFSDSGAGQLSGVIHSDSGIPPLAPGETATMSFDVDGSMADGRYLSFASMVIPSNDAFIGNDDPMAMEIFDASGSFVGGEAVILGSDVLDAGTEVNDEDPMNTAFFGQSSPDTGDDQGGSIGSHTGFMDPGNNGILDDPMFADADFTEDGYQVAMIETRAVPEPASLTMFGLLGAGALSMRRRGRRSAAS